MATIVPIASGRGTWMPHAGEFFHDLSQRLELSEEESAALSADTVALLSKCVDPHSSPRVATGLVTGYVQSGKTRSIESVLCVARDSGYRMAIVLTGTSNALLVQSRGRLERDLGIEEGASDLGWTSLLKPALRHEEFLSGLLGSWTDDRPDWERSTPLLAVLKNATNINKVAELLGKFDLENFPVLVIDDEADQAGLDNNARKPGRPTSTYLSIESMRGALPWHTYLQYTATPQAPLLISISDSLSPEFVHVLVPGTDYTGGQVFFGADKPFEIVREIDPTDLQTRPGRKVPFGLKQAFRQYLLGVAAGLQPGVRPSPRNRSMFIHPSRFQDPHEQYETWIKFLRDDWRSVLAEAPTSKERRALLEEFRVDYDDLARTAALRDFDDLVPHLHTALGRINVQVVNGKNPDEVRWKTAYPWVLIGGQSLDRGFTVEGLTVSYIPRPIGEGNADNFQQRARFFGYRKPYLDISRVYMDQPSQRAFTNYVEHEETMRAELLEVQRTGSSLKEWKRVFLLDERLKPTRTSVIANGYLRTTIRGWQYPKWPSIDGDRVVQNNLAIDRIKNALTFEPLAGYTRHGVVEGVPVSWLLESLWAIEYAAGQDSRMHTATMLALRKLVDDAPDAVATVYLMDNFRSRVRTTRDDKNGEINPMQGRSPAGSDRYPGDEKVRDEENVSIQLHNIEVVTLQGAVPAVGLAAIRLPKSAVKSFVQQP